jgi:ribonuclease BN (tRNA processing enzyme)
VGPQQRANDGGSDRSPPVTPTIGFRISHEDVSVVLVGDTVPCATLDALAAGADALVRQPDINPAPTFSGRSN